MTTSRSKSDDGMGFERLHPALQYHIVNSARWCDLREVQIACIDPILAGSDVVVLAQTAGGKTEAAFFPLVSRMLSENWGGLCILYISPLRALLENQEARLKGYFDWVGYAAATWHGDVTRADKSRILRDPPSCLLTTPESLEAVMTSSFVDHRSLLGDVRAVVMDEMHAFAADDRGWHLLSLLSRISKLAGRHIQRIGLSATVGNPEQLVTWLKGGENEGRGQVVMPSAPKRETSQVQLDHVGTIDNAAVVISRLHGGEKRLVFCDSRAQVEQLAALLRGLGVRTFVIHSSLSRDLRLQGQTGFASEANCVIVATSALELGIDIGDLDRVVQINSPGSVAAFLQRMGRTGRRPGMTNNCLFLALGEEDVVDCAGLIDLWERGYLEPIEPPPLPYHIFAQQVMALALQNQGIGHGQWNWWLSAVPPFSAMSDADKRSIVAHMVESGLLTEDQGVLWLGRQGEKTFGRRNFLDLLSVFASEPTMTVRQGRRDIGTLDRLPFEMVTHSREGEREPPLLTLAGRHWQVVHIDWGRKVVQVEESKYPGRSRWMGSGKIVSFEMARARLRVLCGKGDHPLWSIRARAAMTSARQDYGYLHPDAITLAQTEARSWECWTFGGTRANGLLALQLHYDMKAKVRADGLRVVVKGTHTGKELAHAITGCLRKLSKGEQIPVSEDAIERLKFHGCIPKTLARRIVYERWMDRLAMQQLVEFKVFTVEF